MFELTRLEEGFSYLDQLPEPLVAGIITAFGSNLPQRVAGLLTWRDALLKGDLPPATLQWPSDTIASPIRQTLQTMNLPRFTKDNEELTDRVLSDFLLYTQEAEQTFWENYRTKLRELEEAERRRLEELQQKATSKSKQKRKRKRKVPPQKTILQKSKQEIEREAQQWSEASFQPDISTFVEVWEERVRVWSQLSEVFDELGALLGLGWDLSLGILRHHSWEEIVKLHKLLKKLPQFKKILQALGRLHFSKDGPTAAERIVEQMIRIEEESTKVWVPTIPQETRGITRSAELTRMLPSEAILLLHPVLRLVWHARRAEQALLTYNIEGEETFVVEREVLQEREREQKKGLPERGPIVVCLDTSGSMSGVPETVAKALTLEAMRVAHSQQRRCYLYAFSGPGQVAERELCLNADGIGTLLEFLQASFSGGTDVDTPVSCALQKLEEDDWELADLLLVSDGEFPVNTKLKRRVSLAQKEKEFRFHGVQIGNKGRTGLHELCEPVHSFGDWADVVPFL